MNMKWEKYKFIILFVQVICTQSKNLGLAVITLYRSCNLYTCCMGVLLGVLFTMISNPLSQLQVLRAVVTLHSHKFIHILGVQLGSQLKVQTHPWRFLLP